MSLRIILVALALVVAGCSTTVAGSPSPSPSELPSTPTPVPTRSPDEQPTVTPTPKPTQPPQPPAPTPAPTPKPIAKLDDVGPRSAVRVLVNGLAVRTGPGTEFPLLAAYRYPDRFVTAELRLNSGHYLVVEHGPVVVNGIPWLLVHNIQQPGESSDETLRWDADGDEFHIDHGWIAGAGSDSSAWVAEDEFPTSPNDPVHGPGPEPYLILTGTGSLTTGAFATTAPAGIDWVAVDPSGGACAMKITVQPSGETLISERVEPVSSGTIRAADGGATVSIGIETECAWSLVVYPEQG